MWAEEGEDKVTQDDLRAARGPISNSVWNGSTIQVFGAKNEVVNFDVVLESANGIANNVSVTFNKLTGPNGALIQSVPTTGDGIFNWTNRNIELFYVEYLQIKGLSLLGYENYYDERHVPQRMRRPWTGNGVAVPGTGWTDRPDHDKFYPDIALPMELMPSFSIPQGNQSVWVDVFIPKASPAGLYTGTFTVSENGVATHTIPVQLTVRNFTLPDVPTAKTMIDSGSGDLGQRYTGVEWPNPGTPQAAEVALVMKNQQLMAHRHKVSVLGDDFSSTDQPTAAWIPVLNGSLFTAANGYDGPGIGVGDNVYSIGTYGAWQSVWGTTAPTGIQTHMNNWEQWFETNSPSTQRFVYVIDESTDYTQTQQWASWMATNPGIGAKLPSMATIDIIDAENSVPALNLPTMAASFGPTASTEAAIATLLAKPGDQLFLYNGERPGSGIFMTEEDGVGLRANAWTQYKEGVGRWFYWEATYYDDYQNGRGQTDVWHDAQTFGATPNATPDPVEGETSYLHTNGDGVLFYPGIDTLFPASNVGVDGPIASLRLKYWRRGIQDVDYLAQAAAINPSATQAIVTQMVPKVVWEVGVDDLSDPTYVHSDISWSNDPDVWENARLQLANIIDPPAASLKKPVPPSSGARTLFYLASAVAVGFALRRKKKK